MKQILLTALARLCLTIPALERLLVWLCHRPYGRDRLRVGAIAYRYLALLDRPALRVAAFDGYRQWVNIADYTGLAAYFFGMQHEPFTAQLALDLVAAGDTFVDVGANMGAFTFLLATKLGSTGRAIAFEPNPELYDLLRRSVALNRCESWVTIDNRAVYRESDRELRFYLSQNPQNTGQSSLVNHGYSVSEDRFATVQTLALADYWQAARLDRCRLMKIDVERAEADVLRGMEPLLAAQAVDYLILEHSTGDEAAAILRSHGYCGWTIEEGDRRLHPSDATPGWFGNVLYASPSQVAAFQQCFAPYLQSEELCA